VPVKSAPGGFSRMKDLVGIVVVIRVGWFSDRGEGGSKHDFGVFVA